MLRHCRNFSLPLHGLLHEAVSAPGAKMFTRYVKPNVEVKSPFVNPYTVSRL